MSAMKQLSLPWWARHQATSCSTHRDAAASGAASRMNARADPSASSIEPQSSGDADRLVWSRKMRRPRRRYQGLAINSSPRSSAGASWPSTAWL